MKGLEDGTYEYWWLGRTKCDSDTSVDSDVESGFSLLGMPAL